MSRSSKRRSRPLGGSARRPAAPTHRSQRLPASSEPCGYSRRRVEMTLPSALAPALSTATRNAVSQASRSACLACAARSRDALHLLVLLDRELGRFFPPPPRLAPAPTRLDVPSHPGILCTGQRFSCKPRHLSACLTSSTYDCRARSTIIGLEITQSTKPTFMTQAPADVAL